ncbi:DUF6207 family protein [Streptomyces sp. NPDC058305]|uniref:DUF6207 family protein n=1 Tax=Streptomyces sp. NPDC058305 TaxID=3346438 RepID=UPI0036E0ED9D
MEPINETRRSRAGLPVADVAAAADATVFAFQQLLAERWATATAAQPGVRLCCYLGLRQPDAPTMTSG